MIGDPIAVFVLPAIVGMSTMIAALTQSGQDHGLRIKRAAGRQQLAQGTETGFDERRNDLDCSRQRAQLVPIDYGLSGSRIRQSGSR
jgi:hypothetical protein